MRYLGLFFALTVALVSSSSFAQEPVVFGLNDVSVLLPLPRNNDDLDLMLSPKQGLGSAEIIPMAILKLLEPLVSDDDQPVMRLGQLRVVGIRFDPCFFEGEGPVVCRRQIRLVFQPVATYQLRPFVVDASVHAFYEFSESEWKQVVQAWVKTASDSPGSALQVHPRILAEGLGAHWQMLKGIVQKFCRPDVLVRVTEITVNRFGMQWNFSGFDIQNGVAKAMLIPRTNNGKMQIFSSTLGDVTQFNSEIYPTPPNEKLWVKFFEDSKAMSRQVSEAELMLVLKRAFEFENPKKFNTGNLDCVSCHVAQSARIWGENNLKHWQNDPEILKVRFASAWNTEFKYKLPFFANRIRAFGYFIDEVNISPRVINETAVAADLLNQSINSSRSKTGL